MVYLCSLLFSFVCFFFDELGGFGGVNKQGDLTLVNELNDLVSRGTLKFIHFTFLGFF